MLNEVDSIRAKYHRDAISAVPVNKGDFYVYIHFRNDTGEPFYVGKGSNRRVKVKNRSYNRHWKNIVNKAGYTAKIIRNCGSDEKLSHDYETELIALFRGIGFGMTNLTNGGEGMSGYKFSGESKRRMSAAKLGENHPNWNKPLSDTHKQNISDALSGENGYWWNKSHSDVTKRKMSEAKLGENNPIFGRTGELAPCFGRTGELHPLFGRTGELAPMYGRTGELAPMYGRTGVKSPGFKGYSIGFNNFNIIIFCGTKDMRNRGFHPGPISSMILNNPEYKSCKGYTAFIRTLDKSEIIKLLETRTFADTQSEEHFNTWV